MQDLYYVSCFLRRINTYPAVYDPMRCMIRNQLMEEPKNPFKGDAEQYLSWASRLRRLMESTDLVGQEKLDVLELHTAGPARELVIANSRHVPENGTEAAFDRIWMKIK